MSQNRDNLIERHRDLFKVVELVGNPAHDKVQFKGYCPFHEHPSTSKPSFSFNIETGLWHCFSESADCGSGNAVQFAQKIGIDPSPYYSSNGRKQNSQTDFSASNTNSLKKPAPNSGEKPKPLSEGDLRKWRTHVQYLLEHYDSLSNDLPWKRETVTTLNVGFDAETEQWAFLQLDNNHTPINIKWHRGKQISGHGQCRFYPWHLLSTYDRKRPLILCEGEKDCVTLISHKFQAVTGTTGAGSIPTDLSPIAQFKQIIIAYDNDEAGREGAKKMAKVLQQNFPSMQIRVHFWNSTRAKGFDITEYFQDGGNALELHNQLFQSSIFHPDFNGSVTDYPCTDTGNAELFRELYGYNFRFNHEKEKWYIWNGQFWEADAIGSVKYSVIQAARFRQEAAENIPNDETRATHWKAGKKLENNYGINACLSITKSLAPIATVGEQWNNHSLLLQCENGVFDLMHEIFRPGIPADLLSQSIHTGYNPDATSPRWDQFLKEVTQGDIELTDFLQRAIGYSLTGLTTEECLFFIWGPGADGKSTFIETLLALFGDYGQKAPQTMLMPLSYGSHIPNDIARLQGARFVATSEVDKDQSLAESLVKELTGGDTVTARFLRQEFFDFKPTHKLWIHGNHKPTVRGADDGIWRRIRLVPFSLNLPKEKRDPNLKSKLLEELPGILNWGIEGYRKWKNEGLRTPNTVQKATGAYRKEMDIIGRFLNEKTEEVQDSQVRAHTLYRQYKKWCQDENEEPENSTKFGTELTNRGLRKKRDSKGRFYENIKIR